MIGNGQCDDVKVASLAPVGPAGAANGLFSLRLENPGWPGVAPGQFAMLRPARFGLNPLWARPFSVSRLTEEHVSFVFQIVGRGTREMADMRAGEAVTLWGPLGRGFAVEPESRTLLLAGGIGIAPFVEYAARHPAPERVHLFFGHRPPLDCYPYDEIGERVSVEHLHEQRPEDLQATIALLEERVADYRDGLILACGPGPFLRTVSELAAKHGARAQVSLENRMACGVGACLGCVEKDAKGRSVQVCKRGPVFWTTELEWGAAS